MNKIREIRKKRNWSLARLAEEVRRRTGVRTSAQQMMKLEKGLRRLSDVWLDRLAPALEVSRAEILGEEPLLYTGITRAIPDGRRVIVEEAEKYALPPAIPELIVSAVVGNRESIYKLNTLQQPPQMIEVTDDFTDGEPFRYLPNGQWYKGLIGTDEPKRKCFVTGIIRYIISPCNTELEET